MKYIEYVNQLLQEEVKHHSPVVLYGQNIDAGSCLSGLTKGLAEYNSGLTINTPNSEYTLTGIGFGMMLNSVSSVFFMKQLDFLLLGVDHLVNTYNIVRQKNPEASFTIFPVVVDSGYEGPQAALNNVDDFSSLAGVDAYSFTNKVDTKLIVNEYLFKPGFRILCTGQRLLKNKTLDIDVHYNDPDFYFFHYFTGNLATIVCFNQTLDYGVKLYNFFLEKGKHASLFSVNAHHVFDFEYLLQDVNKTKKIIVIDDSKSRNRLSDIFLNKVLINSNVEKMFSISHDLNSGFFYPRNDDLNIDFDFFGEQFL